MPNHVYSVLKFIYHDDNGEMVDKIIKTLRSDDSDFDFRKLKPQPEGIQDERKEVLSSSERDWNIENWGTKWSAYDVEVKKNSHWSLIIRFQTAYDVPKPIIEKIIQLFPDVEIQYIGADDGSFFACHIIKDPENPPEINLWNNLNDKGGIIRNAIFQSLNNHY